MGIKRYIANKDNTITNAFNENLTTRGTGSNMGASDILEVFSIYGQTTRSGSTTGIAKTQELSRVLVQFPVDTIVTDRASGELPASGNVEFYLRLFNAEHSNTTPKAATYIVSPISSSWEEGLGLDMDNYADKTKNSIGSNWIKRAGSTSWQNIGGDYLTAYNKVKTLPKGTENLEVDITDIVENWIKGQSGGGYENYGLGVRLTSSQEAYFSSSTGIGVDNSIQNVSGAIRSYYTKKFFARSSEFFFMKPLVEARWDSTIKDDRGKINYSSSLLTAEDNLNTIFLYNYVNGQLKNIPGGNTVFVQIYSGSSTAPTGNPLNLVTTTEHVNSSSPTVITGGLYSTGIYSASFALTAASTPFTTIYDVWSLDDSGQPGMQVKTGSMAPQVYSISSQAIEQDYVFNISNLRSSYMNTEKARFKVFSRLKNWSPTIYTVADADPENVIIDNMYYRITRVIDNQEAISFGTGSAVSPEAVGSASSYTRLSYDENNSYFDIDMSYLEPGYMYRIELIHFNNNQFVGVNKSFKFRVEGEV